MDGFVVDAAALRRGQARRRRGARGRAEDRRRSSPRTVGADPAALTRVLRGLALEDVVSEHDGRFALTPLGECLRADGRRARGPRRALLPRRRGPARRGRARAGPRSSAIYGAPFFAHLDAHAEPRPRSRPRWPGAPSRRPTRSSPPTTSAASSGWSTSAAGAACCSAAIVDARPGRARACSSIARRPRSPPRASSSASGRVRRGRLLRAVPAGRRRLPALARPARLARRGRAAHPRRRPRGDGPRRPAADRRRDPAERAVDEPHAIRMDLHMLLLLGARERTEAEFRALLAARRVRRDARRADRFPGRPRRHRGVLSVTSPADSVV